MCTPGPRRNPCVHQDTWVSPGSWTCLESTDLDLPVSVQESLVEAWVGSGLLQVLEHWVWSAHTGHFEGGSHFYHYLNHSLVAGQTTWEHSPAHLQKIGLKIYQAWPCHSEQDPVSPSVSLSHQEASISLLSLSIRGQTEWKPQSQKTNQTDHMDNSLL